MWTWSAEGDRAIIVEAPNWDTTASVECLKHTVVRIQLDDHNNTLTLATLLGPAASLLRALAAEPAIRKVAAWQRRHQPHQPRDAVHRHTHLRLVNND